MKKPKQLEVMKIRPVKKPSNKLSYYNLNQKMPTLETKMTKNAHARGKIEVK